MLVRSMQIAMLSQPQSVGWAMVVGGLVAGLGCGAIWFSYSRLNATNMSAVTRVSLLVTKYFTILRLWSSGSFWLCRRYLARPNHPMCR